MTIQSSILPTPDEARQRAVDAAVQKVLVEQRERIAADVWQCGCAYPFSPCLVDRHDKLCPIAIAAAIRSGEIGEDKK